jgi:hypothetical protein
MEINNAKLSINLLGPSILVGFVFSACTAATCPSGTVQQGTTCKRVSDDASVRDVSDAGQTSVRAAAPQASTMQAPASGNPAGTSNSGSQSASSAPGGNSSAATAGADAANGGAGGRVVIEAGNPGGGAGTRGTPPAAGATTQAGSSAEASAAGSAAQAGSNAVATHVCGDGVKDSGETCDGDCPTSSTCKPSSTCMTAVFAGDPLLCTSTCTRTLITAPRSGDHCCPDGANSIDDSDCGPDCGNGIVEAGETCDNGPNSPRPCPTSCDDQKVCTADRTTGSAESCDIACVNELITTPKNGDGCCPRGANATADSDCDAICGNGVTESPREECDPNEAGWSPWTCNSDSCRPQTLYTPCSSQSQCAADEVCPTDIWVCTKRCDKSAANAAAAGCYPTPAGETSCSTGILGPICVVRCTGRWECAPGLSCSSGVCMGCVTDADCPANKHCNIPSNTQTAPHGYCL